MIYVYCDTEDREVKALTRSPRDYARWIELTVPEGHPITSDTADLSLWRLNAAGDGIEISLDAHKKQRINALRQNVKNAVFRLYPPHNQISLSFLFTDGVVNNYTDRIAYIGVGMGWVNSVLRFFYVHRDAIEALTTIRAVKG